MDDVKFKLNDKISLYTYKDSDQDSSSVNLYYDNIFKFEQNN